ncbi:MAG: hypothetical protein DMF25_07465 [Verrucomicrobia bacterium]|nr:MAG: hypothetical protein DMF25_07465 [Verrucomicrobiota bacterium]
MKDHVEVEWEILPPEDRQRRNSLEPLFKWLALIMDEFLRLPGTKFRFGLDPIIGLLPGLGDTASAIISTFALVYAARCRLPKIVLARIAVWLELFPALVTRFRSGSNQTRAITNCFSVISRRRNVRGRATGSSSVLSWRFYS